MNQKQIPTSKNQIPNNMKPMKQKLILSSKSSFLAVFLLLPISGQAATVLQWSQGGPVQVGDKKYTFVSADTSLLAADVDMTEASNIHSLNLTNLTNIVAGSSLIYKVEITDLSNFYYVNRTSQNDVLGNVTGGSTTTVFDGAFNLVNNTILLGSGSGPTLATGSGLQTIFVQTKVTGVDGGTNKLANVTFDLVQTSAIPEVTSSFSLLAMLSSGLLLRRRTKS